VSVTKPWLNDSPYAPSYETATLEAVRLCVQQAVSKELLGAQNIEFVAEEMSRQMIFRLRAMVYEDPKQRRRDVHRIVEECAHPTWKHALIASLPEAALYRRRFLGYLWDIEPMYANTRVVHEVAVTARGLFPDMSIHYPKELGTIQYMTKIEPLGSRREEWYV
jgi:hypothetical protein